MNGRDATTFTNSKQAFRYPCDVNKPRTRSNREGFHNCTSSTRDRSTQRLAIRTSSQARYEPLDHQHGAVARANQPDHGRPTRHDAGREPRTLDSCRGTRSRAGHTSQVAPAAAHRHRAKLLSFAPSPVWPTPRQAHLTAPAADRRGRPSPWDADAEDAVPARQARGTARLSRGTRQTGRLIWGLLPQPPRASPSRSGSLPTRS